MILVQFIHPTRLTFRVRQVEILTKCKTIPVRARLVYKADARPDYTFLYAILKKGSFFLPAATSLEYEYLFFGQNKLGCFYYAKVLPQAGTKNRQKQTSLIKSLYRL